MRLSEERIEAISVAITDHIAEEELIDLTMSEDDLANLIAMVIAKDLAIEDDIQREAAEWIRINKKHLDPGSSPWQIEQEKQRRVLAVRRNYVLPS